MKGTFNVRGQIACKGQLIKRIVQRGARTRGAFGGAACRPSTLLQACLWSSARDHQSREVREQTNTPLKGCIVAFNGGI